MSAAASRWLFGAALAGALAAATPLAAKELVFGSWVGPRHATNEHGLAPMFEALRKDTNGALDWRILAGGQIVTGRSTLEGLRDGLVDGGLVIPIFTPRELAHNNVLFSMEYYGEDPVAVTGAATETIMLHCPQCKKEYDDNNAVFLGGYGVTNFILLCNAPVTGVETVRGKRISGTGASTRWISHLGAVPVPMSAADAVPAVQRRAIDCVIGSYAWLRSYGYADIVSHIVEFQMGNPRAVGLLVMNRASWTALPAEHRAATLRHLPAATARATITGYIEEDIDNKKLARERGITITEDVADYERVRRDYLKTEWQALIDGSKANLSVPDPESVMTAFMTALDKWEKLSAEEIRNDVDRFAAALQREIYNKIDFATY